MVVSNRVFLPQPTLELNSKCSQQANAFKYLGMYLDKRLKYQTQIDHISNKLSSLVLVESAIDLKIVSIFPLQK